MNDRSLYPEHPEHKNSDLVFQMYSEAECRKILSFFDSLDNAVSIFDRSGNLIFANIRFCKDFKITDRASAVGKPIMKTLQNCGLCYDPIAGKSNRLKMFEVLETGQKALDWEVRYHWSDTPSKSWIASNDMYPIKNNNGDVIGMIELGRSREQDLNRAAKITGGLAAEYSFNDIIGSSNEIHSVKQLARDYSNTSYNVLITGESGVGKELFAQSIHNNSPRHSNSFIAVNCANFSESLIESELFGYTAGAFTGASKNGHMGKFELANGGTLFLDEIGELPFHFQSKFLRVLEIGKVTRIGSSTEIPINVRIICATNRDLDDMVKKKLFREDLYYRLQVLTLHIPPLRDRKEDILDLANHFLKESAGDNPDDIKQFDINSVQMLKDYPWPGNVRELRNVMRRVALFATSTTIDKASLEAAIYYKQGSMNFEHAQNPRAQLSERKAEVKQAYVNLILEALDASHGNKTQAAKLLGVSRRTLYYMIDRYKLYENLSG